MSRNNARIALYTHIQNNFSSAEICFSGNDQRAESLENGTDPWIYIYIAWGGEVKKSTGSPYVRFVQIGTLAAKLYVRKEDGEGILDTITDDYSAITRCKQIGNITIDPMRAGPTRPNEKWQVRDLYSPFSVSNHFSILPV
jgi:hypothetical protein